jgi:CheY-like chemotaxis protein
MTTAACLVLDIGLPGLPGFELYQRLIETGTKLPVIFITGHNNSSGSERGRSNSISVETGSETRTTGRDYSSPQLGQRYAASLLEGFPFVRQLIPINQLMCHPERHLGKAGLQKAGLPTHEETD